MINIKATCLVCGRLIAFERVEYDVKRPFCAQPMDGRQFLGVRMRLNLFKITAVAAALLALAESADASTVVYKATFDATLENFQFLPLVRGLNTAVDLDTGLDVDFDPNDFTLAELGYSNRTGGMERGETRASELEVHFDGTNYTINCTPTVASFRSGYCVDLSDSNEQFSINNNVIKASVGSGSFFQMMTFGPSGGIFRYEDDAFLGGVFGNIAWNGYFIRYSYSYSNVNLLVAPSPIPLPASALLFVPAIGAFVALGRRSRKRRAA